MPRPPSLRILVFAFALAPTAALAQASRAALPDEVAEVPIEYAKETHLDFGLLDVTATNQGPELKLVDGPPPPPPREPMIRVRISFDDMMLESAAQIR